MVRLIKTKTGGVKMSKKATRTVSTKVDLKDLLNPSEMNKKPKNKTPKKIKDKRK